MKNHDQKYVMRAPPRRRTKGDELDDQPVFLRKAFTMISTCPAEIGGWSEKGDTVVIRDVKQFSEKIIPTAYKHNNFSSFVRQLNFYGFRKVKSESMDHADWWEFRHPQFLRDEPSLLSEIKRSVHFTEASNGQEVNDLRTQVSGLNDQIAAMHDQIDRLADMVSNMQVAAPSSSSSIGDAQKKRKLTVKGAASSSSGVMLGAVPLQRMSSTDSTMMIGEYRAAGEDLPSGPDLLKFADGSDFFGDDGAEGMNANTGAGAQDWDGQNEDLDMLFSAGLMDEDEPGMSSDRSLPQASAVMAAPITATAAPAAAAIGVVNNAATEISNVLDGLSPELRLRFVDRLAEVMGAHLTQNIAQQVQAQQQEKAVPYMVPATTYAPVASSPYSAAPEAGQFLLPSGSRAPEIAIPLASAAIAALLSSMQSFSQSHQAHLQQPRPQAQHLSAIKEEVACK